MQTIIFIMNDFFRSYWKKKKFSVIEFRRLYDSFDQTERIGVYEKDTLQILSECVNSSADLFPLLLPLL